MKHMIAFSIAANASLDDVAAMKDDIDTFFGIGGDDAATIEPEAAATQPGDVTLDKAGLPWDARIHASSKAMNEDGTWRAKRGVDKKVKTKVEADLLKTVNVTAPTAPAAPALPPLPGAPAAKNEYTEFVEYVVANTQPNGRLTDDWVKSVLEYHDVPDGDIQNLAHNTALIATVKDYIVKALS